MKEIRGDAKGIRALEERNELCRCIADLIWDPEALLREVAP